MKIKCNQFFVKYLRKIWKFYVNYVDLHRELKT
jgi:hypothetical protein